RDRNVTGVQTCALPIFGEHLDIEALTADQIAIQQPLLFGKWMPIYEDGCYYLNDHIPFDSPRFHEQAIYIHDFTKMIVALLKQRSEERRVGKECRVRVW